MLKNLMKEKLRSISRHFWSIPEEYSDLGAFMVLSPEENSKDGIGVVIFILNFKKGVCVVRCI